MMAADPVQDRGPASRPHERCQGVSLCEECAAAYLGVGVTLFRQEVRLDVPPIPIGKRRIVYARKALDRYVEKRMEEEACHARFARGAGPGRRSTQSRTGTSSGVASRSTANSSGDPLVRSILERLKPRPGPSGSES